MQNGRMQKDIIGCWPESKEENGMELLKGIIENGNILIFVRGQNILKVEQREIPAELNNMKDYSTEVIANAVAEFTTKLYDRAMKVLEDRKEEEIYKALQEDILSCSRLTNSILDELCKIQFGSNVA